MFRLIDTLRAKLSPGQHALRPRRDRRGDSAAALTQLRQAFNQQGRREGGVVRVRGSEGRRVGRWAAGGHSAQADGTMRRILTCWNRPADAREFRIDAGSAWITTMPHTIFVAGSDSGAPASSRALCFRSNRRLNGFSPAPPPPPPPPGIAGKKPVELTAKAGAGALPRGSCPAPMSATAQRPRIRDAIAIDRHRYLPASPRPASAVRAPPPPPRTAAHERRYDAQSRERLSRPAAYLNRAAAARWSAPPGRRRTASTRRAADAPRRRLDRGRQRAALSTSSSSE